MNFWEKMKGERNKPILCLAPMADVTDVAFRFVISKNSQTPHVTYTEFVSADGLARAPEAGRRKLLKDLEYSEIERPIIAQFFTSNPEHMEKASALAVELGFDGVDINMGCPDKSIEKQGAGAALIKNPKLAQEIILAAKRGAGPKVPVSVKTRIGYNKDELETWLPALLETNPAAIVLHARTRKEMSKVPARWERVKRAVEIRDGAQFQKHDSRSTDIFLLKNSSCSLQSSSQASSSHISETAEGYQTLIIGNGDVLDMEDAYRKCEESGADGAMLGRAVFGNPFLFATRKPDPKEHLLALSEHIKLFDEKLGEIKNFAVMKKHFKAYLALVANTEPDPACQEKIRDLKWELLGTESAKEAVLLVNNFLELYN